MTPSRIIAWGNKTGEKTALVVTNIMDGKPHPEQGFRACMGLLRLGKKYGNTRLEAACTRASLVRSFSYQSVKSILKAASTANYHQHHPHIDGADRARKLARR